VTVLTLVLTLAGTRLPGTRAAGAITVVLFGLGWFVGVLGSIALVVRRRAACPRRRLGMRVLIPTDGPVARRHLRPELAAGAGWPRAATRRLAANPFFANSPPPL
jgi:hypothetical protein